MKISTEGSTNISSATYDSTLLLLTVKFVSGAVYQYLGVPYMTAQDFARAESKGGFLAKHIKGKFKTLRLE